MALLDSIFRGYPIGDLLLLQRPAPKDTFSLGSRTIEASERPDAWMIVDGQQRLVALTGALLHPDATPQGDIYAIWFDLEAERFHWAAHGQDIPDLWIPVRALADSRELHRWWNQWPLRAEREDLLDRVYDISKALREYEVPAYILHNAPEDAVRVVFQRINSRGTQMLESEVFNALAAIGETQKPLKTLAEALAPLGFGNLDPRLALRCVKASTGADPGADLSERQNLDMQAVAASLRLAIVFLQVDVGVPHGKLSPYFVPLLVMSRFFAVFPDATPRDRLLMSRWVWRGFLNGAHSESGHASVRRLQGLIAPGESADVVQALLAELRDRRPNRGVALDLQRKWTGTAAEIKLAQIALLKLGARSPMTSEQVDVGALCERLNTAEAGALFLKADPGAPDVIAGRFLLLGGRKELKALLSCRDEVVLASHGLDPDVLACLQRGDISGFLRRRGLLLDLHMRRFFAARAEWDASDRPSISAMVQRAKEGVDGRA